MKLSTIRAVAEALQEMEVRYQTGNVRRALAALEQLGFQPTVPISLDDCADPELRRSWIRDRGMQVFSLFSDRHPGVAVDIFVDTPFDFDVEYGAAETVDLGAGRALPFVRLRTLIEMKEADPMSDAQEWESATWEGARRQQIRRALARTVLERLEVMEELWHVSQAVTLERPDETADRATDPERSPDR